MTSFLIAACFIGPFCELPSTYSLAIADIPFVIPKGWKSEKSEGSMVITPGDVPEGKVFVVMVTPTEGKAGSLDDIFAAGKKMVGELGTFKALTEAVQGKTEGDWDYKFLLGGVEKGGGSFLAQIMAIKKEDEGGVIIVVSDSLETMQKYAGPFGEMLRSLGGKKEAPAPPSVAEGGGTDLQYTVPAGWTERKVNGFPLLERSLNDFYTKYGFSLLVLPTEPIVGSVRATFAKAWQTYITPNYTNSIVPLPLMARLKSGYACAFDADMNAKNKNGSGVTAALFLVCHGGKATPVIGTFWGFDNSLDTGVEEFLQSARIPGASNVKVPLFSAADVVGDWSESSYSLANYVTSSGGYAGDASIATGSYVHLKSDGTYTYSFFGISSTTRIREKNEGTWKVEEDSLVLSKGGNYTLHGYGSDPKVGRFLVLGMYSGNKSTLRFSNPRGQFQATWFKSKQ